MKKLVLMTALVSANVWADESKPAEDSSGYPQICHDAHAQLMDATARMIANGIEPEKVERSRQLYNDWYQGSQEEWLTIQQSRATLGEESAASSERAIIEECQAELNAATELLP